MAFRQTTLNSDYVIYILSTDWTGGEVTKIIMSFALPVRLRSLSSPFFRKFQTHALSKPVPPPRGRYVSSSRKRTRKTHVVAGDISTPESFLRAIGRSSETKLSVDGWEALWKTNSLALKKAGLAVRDRRYVALAETVGWRLTVGVDTFFGRWNATARETTLLTMLMK